MTKRDVRIDVIRGIAMVTILLNHFGDPAQYFFGLQGPLIPTPTHFGYSSAASLFVAMSGYMVGLVYLHRNKIFAPLLKRAAKIYVVNLIAFAVAAPLALLAFEGHDYFWRVDFLRQSPVEAVFQFLTFRYSPIYLDVLQLYVILLLAAPFAIIAARRSAMLLGLASVSLWLTMQILPNLLYGNGAFASDTSFNPFAWQMIFFLPMIAGGARLHERLFDWLRVHPSALVALIFSLGLLAVAHRLQILENYIPYREQLLNRRYHSPVWTMHAMMMIVAYAGILAWMTPAMNSWPFKMLATLGRNSLSVFAGSIPMTYILLLIFERLQPGYLGYLVGCGSLLAASWVNAYWSEGRKARHIAGATSGPKPARGTSHPQLA
jgi:hypothetical protein